MKKLLLTTAAFALVGTVASAQNSLFNGVTLSYGGGLQMDNMSVDRGGLWNATPASSSQARDDMSFTSAYIETTATFGSGAAVTLSYGQIFDSAGQNFNQEGVPAWSTSDAEGHIIGLSLAAPLGNGFNAELGLRHFNSEAMTAENFARNQYGPCPDAAFDNCYYTHSFITADAAISYTANLSNNMFYTLGGGLRFTQGYTQIEIFDDDGDDESGANVGPLFSIDPVLSATIGYDLGAYDISATATLVNETLSYGIGFSTSLGDRQTTDVGNTSYAIGAFTEFNSFNARRLIAWESQGLVDNNRRGTLSTEIATAGVFGEFSTGTTDVRVSLGTVFDGTLAFTNNDGASGSDEPAGTSIWEWSEASGTHIAVALSTDLVGYGNGMIRGDFEIDYMSLEFDEGIHINPNRNRPYLAARAETLTTAIGASYHTEIANGLTGYAGLDYIASGGHFVMSETEDFSTNRQSNRSPALDSSYRVRLGANYDIGGINANFEVSGSHSAGVSVALGGSWSF